MDWLLIMITNPFEIPVIQKLKTFSFFGTEIYSLFKNINKIQSDKIFETQVHLFHAHADIKARFTSFKSTFKNENIHEQKQGDRS